ncbi:centrosomal protein [Holotrichia oblita]|uniref:Centrosomal protein n=1 Tax=Holotrichia oblita TaxID=644536 RepID=A0ACB9SN36_HOLOL|nr:centrosomal protein [Holotrichia oblita]
MVVVSGSWVKNVAIYPTPASNNDMVIPTNTMSAKALLICRPNSHPFQERTLCLDQPVKVGRSLARAKATPTNAIFDCKVLSRHHAVLWYDCGKFYLQDTKSSNGTFVNNNRISSNDSEPHEVSSGDIVQFGVDVVENNRKVTHGCIIATLKLYLPDGKEAKASPSIIEGNRHGYVPLEELYKLNQIIQEASQREQCLETKLIALQHIVDEARRSAEESWQAYVGEERLLSRVAALENQLTQVGKNWGEDRLRGRITKIAFERLEAVAAAAEHQRARATAEQEAMLARDELEKAQKEIQQIAQKLTEERKRSDDEKANLEQRLREVEVKLEQEEQSATELQEKLENIKSLSINPVQDTLPLEQLERCKLIIENDLQFKEDMIEKNDEDMEMNRSNDIEEPQQNHINRSVVPALEQAELINVESEAELSEWDSQDDLSRLSDESFISQSTVLCDSPKHEENDNRCNEYNENAEKDCVDDDPQDESIEEDEEIRPIDVNSKTLKYQFQTAQNELKRQIENLEQIVNSNKLKISELEDSLSNEKHMNLLKGDEVDSLKDELLLLTQKWKESCNEAQQLRDKVAVMKNDLLAAKDEVSRTKTVIEKKQEEDSQKCVNNDDNIVQNDSKHDVVANISMSKINEEQFSALEEELIILKERFAQINEEKLVLSKNLTSLNKEYNSLQNRSHNTMFFYIAPLALAVLYLLVSSMFS